LNDIQREGLEGGLLVEEVWAEIADADGNKSLGSDGFIFIFLKKFWGLL
jgi:hypothetical protein